MARGAWREVNGERTFREIAEQLGLAKQTVQRDYRSAIRKLRRNRKTLAQFVQLVEYKRRIKDGMEA
jgi:FixJ family two-component response regulator